MEKKKLIFKKIRQKTNNRLKCIHYEAIGKGLRWLSEKQTTKLPDGVEASGLWGLSLASVSMLMILREPRGRQVLGRNPKRSRPHNPLASTPSGI